MTTYSEVSNIDPNLVEVSFSSVSEGDSVLFNGEWYKALENAREENGFIGFKAESVDFEETAIEFRKSDMAYAPKLYMERNTAPTAE